METLFYYKYSASMFLNRSGFKFPSEICKDKQVWLLIISTVKAFDNPFSTFFVIITPVVLKSSKI